MSTPLRYPGGKSVLSDYFRQYLLENEIINGTYAEPYCGGAGAAISLLLSGDVDKILLNDANYAIYSFWAALKYRGEEFLSLFDSVDVTLAEWHYQRAIFKDEKEKDILKKGFATFFINRCNRSGILSAGPIGGQTIGSQLKASCKIDARFNKTDLRIRLERIIKKSDGIEVFNLDALTFLKEAVAIELIHKPVFVYLDPPYFNQGASLYLNYYKSKDHSELSEYLKSDEATFNWVLSYDNVLPIKSLYNDLRCFSFFINYSAQQSKLGDELMVFSQNSIIPESNLIKMIDKKRKIELVPA